MIIHTGGGGAREDANDRVGTCDLRAESNEILGIPLLTILPGGNGKSRMSRHLPG